MTRNPVHGRAIAVMAGAAIAIAALPATSHAAAPRPLYWGATVGQALPTRAAFAAGGPYANLEAQVGKGLAMIQWGQQWRFHGRMQRFPRAYMDHVRAHGSIPVLNWGSQGRVGRIARQPRFRLSRIIAGRYDGYIRRWARAARRWGHPFMLRFDHEMNGWWFPWAEGHTGSGRVVNRNRPGEYVLAWRHVHDIFTQVGARNVTWLWTPNFIDTGTRYAPLSQLYPGDKYVDWTGFSAYNRAKWVSPAVMLTGEGTDWLGDIYRAVRAVAPRKPMLLAETASVEDPADPQRKASWITDFLTQVLPTRFKRIQGFLWYDSSEPAYPTEPVASSEASRAAFAEGIASPLYQANVFGSLSRKRIPLPGRAVPAPTPASRR